MAEKATEAFDSNFNMRCYSADRDAFYEACANNGEPDGATVVRRMMADYTDGLISYEVQQKEED